jgi:hypothetical protein
MLCKPPNGDARSGRNDQCDGQPERPPQLAESFSQSVFFHDEPPASDASVRGKHSRRVRNLHGSVSCYSSSFGGIRNRYLNLCGSRRRSSPNSVTIFPRITLPCLRGRSCNRISRQQIKFRQQNQRVAACRLNKTEPAMSESVRCRSGRGISRSYPARHSFRRKRGSNHAPSSHQP